MKIKIKIGQIVTLFVTLLFFTSCNKYKEVAKAEYPGQILYMPTAVSGIYYASTDGPNTYNVPTEGGTSHYNVDETKGKLIIPLGVYRGGSSRDGGFSINIAADASAITTLINDGTLTDIGLLPSEKYVIPASVKMDNGAEFVTFNLEIDLNFLKANLDKKFAIAIGITSSEREVNPEISTTIVVFDASVL